MKTLLDNKEFCRETFAGPDASRDAIVAAMTRAHGSAQNTRRLRRVSVLLALIATTALLFHKSPTRLVKQQIVQSQPTYIVHTAPFAGVVHTSPLSVATITSVGEPSFAIVHTTPDIHQDINDDQLLSLFKSRAVALVKSLAGARLEFLDQPTTAQP